MSAGTHSVTLAKHCKLHGIDLPREGALTEKFRSAFPEAFFNEEAGKWRIVWEKGHFAEVICSYRSLLYRVGHRDCSSRQVLISAPMIGGAFYQGLFHNPVASREMRGASQAQAPGGRTRPSSGAKAPEEMRPHLFSCECWVCQWAGSSVGGV